MANSCLLIESCWLLITGSIPKLGLSSLLLFVYPQKLSSLLDLLQPLSTEYLQVISRGVFIQHKTNFYPFILNLEQVRPMNYVTAISHKKETLPIFIGGNL